MSTAVATISKTWAFTAARSVNYTATALLRLTSDIGAVRGLDLTYLQKNLEVIEAGLRTWILGQWLEKVRIEVYDPGTDQAVEVYDFGLAYEPSPGGRPETYETKAESLREELSKLHKLRPGLDWRIIVQTKDGRPDVPGWSTTKTRDTGGLSRRDAGKVVSSAGCDVQLTYFFEGGSQCA
jgi:hypothetical protein